MSSPTNNDMIMIPIIYQKKNGINILFIFFFMKKKPPPYVLKNTPDKKKYNGILKELRKMLQVEYDCGYKEGKPWYKRM